MKQLVSKDIALAQILLSNFKESLPNHEQRLSLEGPESQCLQQCFDYDNTHTVAGKLSTVKKLRDVFNALTWLFEDIHARGKAEALRTEETDHASFLDLSDDLIFMIYQHVVDDGGSIEPLIQVSSSFYWRLVNIPELWTYLTAEKNPTLGLERSSSCQLKVSIQPCLIYFRQGLYEKEIKNRVSFFTLVGHHATRWTSFSFGTQHCERDIFKLFASPAFPKVFPSLQVLDLSYYSGETPERNFIGQWKMPALKSLTLNDYIPSGMTASPEQLTLNFIVEDPDFACKDYTSLLTNSASLTSLLKSISPHDLKELNLTFTAVGHTQSQTPFHEETPAILPRLAHLTLAFDLTTTETVVSLLASFEAPNVQNLKIRISYTSPDFPVHANNIVLGTVQALFPLGRARWPKTTSLDITMRTSDHRSLRTAITRLPPLLEHLSINYQGVMFIDDFEREGIEIERMFAGEEEIEVSNEQPLEPIKGAQLRVIPLTRNSDHDSPPLRSLTLQSVSIDMSFLKDNLKVLSSREFERLTIEGCPFLVRNKDKIKAMLPEDKIVIA